MQPMMSCPVLSPFHLKMYFVYFVNFSACSSTVDLIGPLPEPPVLPTLPWPDDAMLPSALGRPSPASCCGAGAALLERSTPEEVGC